MTNPSPSTSSALPTGGAAQQPNFRSIFGTDPLDEFTCFVGGWLYVAAQGGDVLDDLRGVEAEIEVRYIVEAIWGLVDFAVAETVRRPL